MAKIANVAITNTFDAWRARSNASFDRLSQFAINNSSLYANTITANVTFTSTGLATLSGRATIGTNLTVSGNTTLGAAGKTITTTGAAAHTGTKTISTNLTVSGNTTLGAAGKTITTTGAAIHTGTKTISTNLTVSGNTTLGAATVATLTASSDSAFTSTGALQLPASTTGNRPMGVSGKIRYNTTTGTFEGYGASSWGSIGGGATGAGGDTVFQENQLIVTTSYTLSTGKSAMSVGPITINGGAAVTVPSGYRWVVL